MHRATDKVALVTGAAGGIGRACAVALAREGARVVVADIDERGAEESCRQIAEAGGKASFQRLDVASESDWATAVQAVRHDHQSLDILVNNAAICIFAPLLDMTFDTWRRQQSINLDGVFLGTKAAVPLMAATGGGSI